MYNPLAPIDDDEQHKRDPFGRVMPKADSDPEISSLGNPAELGQPVGERGRNARKDVARVETMLGRTGALDLKQTDGATGYWGERTREATRTFQKQNGLKVDGQINPGGETIRALAKAAGTFVKAVSGNMRSPRSPRAGGDDGASIKTAIQPLSNETISSNQRMAQALSRRRGIGDFDRFTIDAINTDGAKAVHEIGDLIGQVRAIDPEQADELLSRTRQGIAPENMRLLTQVAAAKEETDKQPESRDTGIPSSPKAGNALPYHLMGVSMDEHGQYYDASGKPVDNPDRNPNVHLAQAIMPAPVSGAVPPISGSVPQVTTEDIDKATRRDGIANDETVADDNTKLDRETKNEILQDLIERGLDPEAAKIFVNLLQSSSSIHNQKDGAMIGIMENISGAILKLLGTPDGTIKGTRDGTRG
ncbi:MAG: peptidoglycan-binding domain-containing protein [Rhodospirillales bacterium]